MSAVAHAALPAAPHPQPPSAAEGARPRAGGHTIKVPLRLVVGAQYPDTALSTYVKIAALSLRPEGCTAKVSVIAGYLGTSKSSVERGLRPLIGPDLVDGITEIPTVRRTLPGGTGESAHRVTRILAAGELWVRIPIRAAEALSPRLLRLYALLAYATARRVPVTAAELAEMLYHHTGGKAGVHLSERQVRRLITELEATGWLTVHRREGERGRHAFETHRHPLHSVPATITAAVTEPAGDEQLALWDTEPAVIHDGSGPGDHDGSLATEEDLSTDRRGETEQAGGIRRRRPHVTSAREHTTVVDTFGRRRGLHLTRTAWQAVWHVLDPVREELTGLTAWEWQRVVTDVLRLLTDDRPERLRDRLQRRSAPMKPLSPDYERWLKTQDPHPNERWRSFARWLIGAALIRHGCEDPDCETGTRWSTGTACPVCALRHETATAKAQQEEQAAATDRRLAARRPQRRTQTTTHNDEHQEQHATATSPVHEPTPAPPATSPAPAPAADVVPLRPAAPWPARATVTERAAATAADIRTAITRHGAAAAVHVYGLRLVAPHLAAPDPLTDDRRTDYAQCQ